jgi:hypothetical protein
MTPLEESKSLQLNPLPSDAMNWVACKSDEVLPNIAFLQEQIANEQAHVAYLMTQMEQLKSRAISENLKQSGQYYLIEITGKRMRNPITNVQKFRQKFPEGYEMIRLQQTRNLEDKFKSDMLNLEDSAIPLGLADAKVGADLVTEFVGWQPQKVSVEVRRMQERLE